MSLLQTPVLRKLVSGLESLCGVGRKKGTRSKAEVLQRHLTLDSLEARVMLSVSPVSAYDIQVSTTYSEDQTTETNGSCMAVDGDGDFVAVWTRGDAVYEKDASGNYILDENGNKVPYIDPNTGEGMIDYNIYARYMTDEVQRITLPLGTEINDTSLKTQYGRLSLLIGGACQQTLSISSVPETPAMNDGVTPLVDTNLNFTYVLSFNGVEIDSITYNESLTAQENADILQRTLQSAGKGAAVALQNVTVTAKSPHEFLITFGDEVSGEQQPLITFERFMETPESAGFLPAIQTAITRQPYIISGIGISHTDPAETARQIELGFQQLQENYGTGPVLFPSPNRIPDAFVGPASAPGNIRTSTPEISVTPVLGIKDADGNDVMAFDITFINASGKSDQPEIVIQSLLTNRGGEMLDDPGYVDRIGVRTLKECSSEFRVNPEEPDDAISGRPQRTMQSEPSVAMDIDGDFVISWTSEVDNFITPGSDTDIYARRFRATTVKEDPVFKFVDASDDTITHDVQCVIPEGDAFLVNTTTNGTQFNSDVGIDGDGNFIVVWASSSQDISFFNGIYSQRYDRDGNRISNEFRVDTETTSVAQEPVVGVSRDGHFAIAWSSYIDETFLNNGGATIRGSYYDTNGAVIAANFAVSNGLGRNPDITFDVGNSFAIAWETNGEVDATTQRTSTNVYLSVYNSEGGVVRGNMRANSGALNAGDNNIWPGDQRSPSVGLDADGDLVVSYDGFGPDTSENIWGLDLTNLESRVYMSYFAEYINATTNADLRVFFNPVTDLTRVADVFISTPYGDPEDGSFVILLDGMTGMEKARSNGDPDSMIEAILVYAVNEGATDEQLARLRSCLNSVFTTLRGEANGAMFTIFDASSLPNMADPTVLYSDSVANADRDGRNTRYYMMMDTGLVWGDVTLRITTNWGWEDITFATVNEDGFMNIFETAAAIETALVNSRVTGTNWPKVVNGNSTGYDGPVEVRVVTQEEIDAREETYWDLNEIDQPLGDTVTVFEIQFQGEAHDQVVSIVSRGGTVQINEWQTLSVNSLDSGWFGITIGENNGGPIFWDPLNPENTQIQLQNVLTGTFNYNDVNVVWNPDEQLFNIIFGGDQAGQNIPTITWWNGFDQQVNVVTGIPARPSIALTGGTVTTQTIRNGGNLNNIPVDILRFTVGQAGTRQEFTGLGVEPDGDFTVCWTQTELYTDQTSANQNILARALNENEDAAGPVVTDIIAPGAIRVEDGAQLTEGLTYLVVTFDEEMRDVTTMSEKLSSEKHKDYERTSVTNPDNWALMKDGVEIQGAIKEIYFGMNRSNDLADLGVISEYDRIDSNKWEAVIIFDSEIVGSDKLESGNYDVVVKNSMTDVVGNPLGRSGYNINGEIFRRTFNVVESNLDEGLVNENILSNVPGDNQAGEVTAGDQYFTEEQNTTALTYSPNATATDYEGDTVTVWTSERTESTAQSGIFARIDYIKWEDATDGRDVSLQGSREICITSNETAEKASVAMTGDGDFIVTWTQNDSVSVAGNTTGQNIWAQRFNLDGTAKSEAFLVNTYTEDTQCNSSVAASLTGDFVITWQSENQDGSGYGIYAQRYNAVGEILGGAQEVQSLNVTGSLTGTFTLTYRDSENPQLTYTTDEIVFDGSTFSAAEDVQNALNAMSNDYNLGLVFKALASGRNQILITFEGREGYRDHFELEVNTDMLIPSETLGGSIYVDTVVDGNSGEFLVNETTERNQIHPSIAMDYTGNFTISWTSYGQNGDALWESNIYARQFLSNDVLYGSNTSLGLVNISAAAEREEGWAMTGSQNPDFYVTTDCPGVVQVINNTEGSVGSGTLMLTRYHILTAAHVVTGDGSNVASEDVSVAFDTEGGRIQIQAKEIIVHPDWAWNIGFAGDLAIIVLAEAAPEGIDGYDIYRGTSEIGSVFTRYGYGINGTGAEGAENLDNQKRTGQNTWEAYGNQIDAGVGVLISDYDNGTAAMDTLGLMLGINNRGLGLAEVGATPGDSGGPAFLNGMVAGVAHAIGPNADGVLLQGGFGEINMDQQVSAEADWIDNILALEVGSVEFLVNENVVAEGGAVTANNQRGNQIWSNVGMDADGDFVITWTSYGQDGIGAGYGAGSDGLNGVYARRFTSTGESPANSPNAFRVNSTRSEDQQMSKVSMDADGDFTIVWESFQDRDPKTNSDTPDSWGIYAQRYASASKMAEGSAYLGANGEIGGEMPINQTKEYDQRFPNVAMTHTGDFVVTWSGYGNADESGIYQSWFFKDTDDTGPVVTSVVAVDEAGAMWLIKSGNEVETAFSELIVTFGEQLVEYGTHGILNKNNWSIQKDGITLNNVISSIEIIKIDPDYPNGLNQKFQVRVIFDGDPLTPGNQPLEPGEYNLRLSDKVEDLFGNPLDGDGDGVSGGDFAIPFSVMPDEETPEIPGDPEENDKDILVNTATNGDQINPAIAMDEEGNYVVVWQSAVALPVADEEENEGEEDEEQNGKTLLNGVQYVVIGQRFDRYGNKLGSQFIISDQTEGWQTDPDVAMDKYGNFVVTWTSTGFDDNLDGFVTDEEMDNCKVYARIYDAFGNAAGSSFKVNPETVGTQWKSSVAMADNGDFIIVWADIDERTSSQDKNYPEDKNGIYGQRFTSMGEKIGSRFLVNAVDTHTQTNPAVACASDGSFTVTWQTAAYDLNAGQNIIARQFLFASGQDKPVPVGNQFTVNEHTVSDQTNPSISMNDIGQFIIGWASDMADGSGHAARYRIFDQNGSAITSELQANTTTLYEQYQPSVSLNRVSKLSGGSNAYSITWTSWGQELTTTKSDGVYCRLWTDWNVDYKITDSVTGTQKVLGEFRINAYREHDENAPVIAMDSYGNLAVAWVGPDKWIIDGEDQGNGPGVVPRGNKPPTDIYTRAIGVNPVPNYTPNTGNAGALTSSSAGVFTSFTQSPTTGTGSSSATLISDATVSKPSASSLSVMGSEDQNDAFLFTATSDGTFSVTVNGKAVEMDGTERSFILDGTSSGVNSLIINARGGESVTLKDGILNIISSGYTLTALNMADIQFIGSGDASLTLTTSGNGDLLAASEKMAVLTSTNQTARFTGCHKMTFNSAGGLDVAELGDSLGSDAFNAKPGEVTLSGNDYTITVKKFAQVYMNSTSGDDTAVLNGSIYGAEVTATADDLTMITDGYKTQVVNFTDVKVISNANDDSAELVTSDGENTFTVSPAQAVLTMDRAGVSYTQTLTGFEYVTATSTGGNDVALFSGSNMADSFTASPESASLTSENYTFTARGFSSVKASGAGNDLAVITTSTNADVLNSTVNTTSITGIDYAIELSGFNDIQAISGGGLDTAILYDSVENDTLNVNGNVATLSNSNIVRTTVGFSSVQVYSRNGGNDSATFTGTQGADNFRLALDESRMSTSEDNKTFITTASGFTSVSADGNGGADTAVMLDSANDDLFTLSLGNASLSSTNANINITGMRTINVRSIYGGNDQVNVTDSVLDDTFMLRPNSLTATNNADLWLNATGFGTIRVTSSLGGNDIALMYDSPGNDSLISTPESTSLSGTGFFNQVSGFKKVKAYATSAGKDTALLYDSIYKDDVDYLSGVTSMKTAQLELTRELIAFEQVTMNNSGNNTRSEAARTATELIFEGTW